MSVPTRFDCTNYLVRYNSHCRLVELLMKLFIHDFPQYFYCVCWARATHSNQSGCIVISPTNKVVILCDFSSAYHRFHVFPPLATRYLVFRFALVTCSYLPTLAIPYRFSRTCDLLHFFPALVDRYMFSIACLSLHFFSRLLTVTVFPRFPPTALFSRACHPSYTYFEFWLVYYWLSAAVK